MNEQTKEWVKRAEDDLRVSRRESRVTDEPSYSAIAFHAQQSVEKYLKALLQEQKVAFTKTHDLVYLLEQILPLKPLWSVYRDKLERLNEYVVESRYPGMDIEKEEALHALKFAEEIKDVVIKELE